MASLLAPRFHSEIRVICGLGADPEWQAIREKTNGPGEMVRKYDLRILTPSPAWARPSATDGLPPEPVRAELFELRVYDVPVGSLAAANEILTASHLPSLAACGAIILGVFENQTGPSTPGITMLLGWQNFEERRKGLRRFKSSPEVRSTEASNVLGSSACVLLEASPFGRPNHHLSPAM